MLLRSLILCVLVANINRSFCQQTFGSESDASHSHPSWTESSTGEGWTGPDEAAANQDVYDLFANKDLEDSFAESDNAEAYGDGDREEEEPQDISDLLDDIAAAVTHSTTTTLDQMQKDDEEEEDAGVTLPVVPILSGRTAASTAATAQGAVSNARRKLSPYIRIRTRNGRYRLARRPWKKINKKPSIIAYRFPETDIKRKASNAGAIAWMALSLINQNETLAAKEIEAVSKKYDDADQKSDDRPDQRSMDGTDGTDEQIKGRFIDLDDALDFITGKGKKINPKICEKKFLKELNKKSGCSDVNHFLKCNPKMHYRTMDGRCNNLHHQYWGSALSPYWRFAPARYVDDLQLPYGLDSMKVNGFPLPSPRTVSFIRLAGNKYPFDPKLTNMFMLFGQYFVHDIDLALGPTSDESFKNGKKCEKTCDYAEPCMPIKVSPKDPVRGHQKCMNFLRNSPACIKEHPKNCHLKREQVNTVTSFIDASQTYGNDPKTARMLRDEKTGKLKWGLRSRFNPRKHNLPEDFDGHYMTCKYRTESNFCFLSGDVRTNENIGLTSIHTLFFREHNRIVDILRKVDPKMPAKMLYEEARKIVGATLQNIIFRDYLPYLLGHEGMKLMGPYKGYGHDVDASVANEMANAAFRCHNMVGNDFIIAKNGRPERIPMHITHFNSALLEKVGIDSTLLGMMYSNQKMPDPAKPMSHEITEKTHLMGKKQKYGMDMGAINIQRGRDHGLQTYVEYVHRCGLGNIRNWDDLKHLIRDPKVLYELQRLYRTPFNVDLYVGGISENLVPGSRVGPTFLCILVETFWRMRDGDRFWHENHQFTKEQLIEIKGTTLEKVICNNSDNLRSVSRDVFVSGGKPDMVECKKIKDINFSYWKGNPIAKKNKYVYGGNLNIPKKQSFFDYKPVQTYNTSPVKQYDMPSKMGQEIYT